MGLTSRPCPKGADSVEYGHQKVRQYKQYWTKDSDKLHKRAKETSGTYPDKDGKLTDKTTHNFSHGYGFRRYGVIGKLLTIKNNPLHIG